MKFRYYFLSFTLIMLAIYGLHVGYVYYFVENPFDETRTQWEHAMSFHFGSANLVLLLFFITIVNIPIWLYSFWLINYGKKHDNYGASFMGDKIRYLSIVFSLVFICIFSILFTKHKDTNIFTHQYIDHMVNNLQTAEVIFDPDIYEGSDPSLIKHLARSSFVYFIDKKQRSVIDCTMMGNSHVCQDIISRDNKGKTYKIHYFERSYIWEQNGLTYPHYILFAIEGEKNRDLNFYTTLYKSELKIIRSSTIAYIAISLFTILINLHIHIRIKQHVIF